MMGEFVTGVFNTSAVMGLSIAAAGILLKISSKRYSARCRKRIWIFMAFSLLIPFHLFRVPGAYTAEIPNVVLREFDGRTANGAGWQGITEGIGQSGQDQPEQKQDVQASQNPSMQVAQSQAAQNPAQSYGQGEPKAELTVADVSFAVWLCVGTLLAAWFAAGYWRMQGRIRRWSSECEHGYVQEIIREIAAKCKLKKIPEVRIMRDSAEGPFTTGVLKNIIILPDDVLHEKDLRFILKHEMIHCRNNDISWKLLFLVVNIIHWFNPLVWYLRRAAEQDMEIACDEEVVAFFSREDRKEYGDVLMSWVERSRYKGSTVSTGYANGVRFLKRRFDSIFNRGKKKNGILLAANVCIFALLIGCAVQLQSGGKVYAKKKIDIDYGNEVRTDVDGDSLAEGAPKEKQEKKQLVINIEDYYSTNLGDPSNLYYIDDNHILWGCGRNDYGQLGQGTQDYDFHENIVQIAENVVHADYCQQGFTIYLTDDGKLYGMGCAGTGALQEYAEISNTMYVNRGLYVVNRPKLLMEDVIYAKCGHDDIVCLLKDGSVWIWGTVWHEGGMAYFIEKPVKILENAVMVTGGWYNHAALLADGSVWTWGYNYAGSCGVKDSMVVSDPVKVAEDAVMVWTGRTESNIDCVDISEFGGEYRRQLENTIILKDDGSYWACGIGIGTEEKMLSRYWEVDYFTVICSDEFVEIEGESDFAYN